MSQLLGLLLLAPDLQERVLLMEAVDGAQPLYERLLRPVVRRVSWVEQRGGVRGARGRRFRRPLNTRSMIADAERTTTGRRHHAGPWPAAGERAVAITLERRRGSAPTWSSESGIA
jgi:hypothetical protein